MCIYGIGLIKYTDKVLILMNKSTYLQDFNIDSKIRAEMNRKTAHKIQQVEKELAWEKEKHELGLKKLEKR